MFLAKTLMFYKRIDVQRALLEQAQGKEVSINFNNQYFSKRPDALFAEGDVLEFAKKKATSFHCSEELWQNPLHIKTGMSKKEIDEIRTGWDLILDIDCPYWPLSKLITHLFIKALEAHDIGCVTVKFSGNKGFHIAVPYEAFPETFQGQPTSTLFPEAPRRIAYYLLDYLVREYLDESGDYLIFDKQYKIHKKKLAKALGKDVKELMTKQDEQQQKIPLLCRSCGNTEMTTEPGKVHTCPVCTGIMEEQPVKKTTQGPAVFNPLSVIEVDTILIAHRHLYRMPYSFHEKSELISLPLHKEDVLQLSEDKATWASPEHVDFTIPFLDREAAKSGEATKLLLSAFDYNPNLDDQEEEKKEYEIPKEAIPEDYFPPCIKSMLQGLKDGRKRALFTLINFLRGAGWSFEQIEETLLDWNERHDEPLRRVTIKGRIRYEKTKKEPAPPHNCKRYYQDFGVCKPDEFCNRIKNPLQYAKLKAQKAGIGKKGGRAKLTDEQKEMRRKFREQQKQADQSLE